MSDVLVLYEGFSTSNGLNKMIANCSCTLIKGTHNIIVDTMTAWDSEKIRSGLRKQQIAPEKIDFVISTHGHSDHIGNNNLFLAAKHIVGFSISHKEEYYIHPFDKGEEYVINDDVKVIPTPGHTLSDVSVIVTTKSMEKIAITGDLFECFEDIEDPNIWLEAGSENPVKQMKNRSTIANLVNWIIPGHGKKFQVTSEVRESLLRQVGDVRS